jgi:hypothetical protein
MLPDMYIYDVEVIDKETNSVDSLETILNTQCTFLIGGGAALSTIK